MPTPMVASTWSRIRLGAALFASSVLGVAGLSGCHLADALKVPAPLGVGAAGQLKNQAGADEVYANAKASVFSALGGGNAPLEWSEDLSDEFAFHAYSNSYYATEANIDARFTTGSGYPSFEESGDYPWTSALSARGSLVYAIPLLETYEPTTKQSLTGEAFALTGYVELIVAETYCSGTPLSYVPQGGGIQYGMPLTDDSLFGVAQTQFDSALAHAAGNDTVTYLASIGLGRVLLDRGHPADAATAVMQVPTGFAYNMQFETGGYSAGPPYSFGFYDNEFYNSLNEFTVADRKGENGLNYVSAHDTRLLLDSSLTTADGTVQYIPEKFEANFGFIPLATGVEAALIQAEAALAAGDSATWLADLNALRNNGCSVTGPDTTCTVGTGQVPGQTVGLPSLVDPATDSGRVSLMFRERAFWLYGTGIRLGDLRRLIRQYNRDQSIVYPTGPYPQGNSANLPSPIPSYGTDVDLTLPTVAAIANGFTETNPHYKGCLTPTTTA